MFFREVSNREEVQKTVLCVDDNVKRDQAGEEFLHGILRHSASSLGLDHAIQNFQRPMGWYGNFLSVSHAVE